MAWNWATARGAGAENDMGAGPTPRAAASAADAAACTCRRCRRAGRVRTRAGVNRQARRGDHNLLKNTHMPITGGAYWAHVGTESYIRGCHVLTQKQPSLVQPSECVQCGVLLLQGAVCTHRIPGDQVEGGVVLLQQCTQLMGLLRACRQVHTQGTPM